MADGTHSRIDKESFNLGEDRDEPSQSNAPSAATCGAFWPLTTREQAGQTVQRANLSTFL